MESKWFITFENYVGLTKKAIELLSKSISSQIDYVLPTKEFIYHKKKKKIVISFSLVKKVIIFQNVSKT